jgi:sec-independent protein translocase protein TatB
MFDISWTEFLLIGVVALIVIGPKELPAVLRTLGQYTRKVRSMAADFQSQFQEAMREAEMADLKKEVDDLATGIKQYDPLKDVRADLESAGKDIQSSFDKPAATATDVVAAATDPVVPEAVESSAPAVSAPEAAAAPVASEIVAAAADPVPSELKEKTAEPESAERAG